MGRSVVCMYQLVLPVDIPVARHAMNAVTTVDCRRGSGDQTCHIEINFYFQSKCLLNKIGEEEVSSTGSVVCVLVVDSFCVVYILSRTVMIKLVS